MNTAHSGEADKIRDDIWRIVGGDFTPDSVGPDRYDELVAKVRGRASEYLDVFESMFLGSAFDLDAHSDLHLSTLLKIVADVEPERVRSLGDQLLKRLDSMLVVADHASDAEALATLLPEQTVSLMQRLNQRRAQLQDVVRSTQQ
jgi:hypothetical protein